MIQQTFIAVPSENIVLGASAYFVYSLLADRRCIVSASCKQVLDRCDRPDSLENHASRIASDLGLGPDKHAVVARVLQVFVRKGLVVSTSAFFKNAPESPLHVHPIASVALITADRPKLLERAVCSYVRQFKTCSNDVDLVAMDDSRSYDARQHNLRSLTEASRDVSARYAGLSEKLSYIAHLTRAGIDPDVAAFTILGAFPVECCTMGANRNAVLLDTVGEQVLTADDDTTCGFVCHPEGRDALCLTSHENPRAAWFYRDRTELLANIKWTSYDIVRAHECLLGADVRSLVLSTPAHLLSWDKTCRHLHKSLGSGGGRIVVTMNGIVGDSGAYTPKQLLMSSGQVRQSLAESELAFNNAFGSREVLSVVPSKTVTHYSSCQATTLGLANTELLPPFFPIGRNEDGVFGTLLGLTAPTSFLGHVPVAIFHDAPPGRKYDAFPSFRIADIVMAVLSVVRRDRDDDMGLTLRFLGREALEIAGLPDADFWEFIYRAASMIEAERLRVIDSVLQRLGSEASHWKQEARTFRAHVLHQLMDREFCIPAEFAHIPSKDCAKKRVQELIRMTGAFLHAWPDMIEAARGLRSRGIRISVEASRAGATAAVQEMRQPRSA